MQFAGEVSKKSLKFRCESAVTIGMNAPLSRDCLTCNGHRTQVLLGRDLARPTTHLHYRCRYCRTDAYPSQSDTGAVQ